MDKLIDVAHEIAVLLKERGETIACLELSAGGLISAALLAVPGASAYFLGRRRRLYAPRPPSLLSISEEAMTGIRSASEPYAALLARTIRERHAATWGLAETGATGPTGNRYGDPAGHACIAVVRSQRARHDHQDRQRRPRQHAGVRGQGAAYICWTASGTSAGAAITHASAHGMQRGADPRGSNPRAASASSERRLSSSN